ncbi:hypothetical protein [Rhizobium alvei]|uniref:Uncharacterized protein n=1 Tax=Rhizobium alvei TaxID=1132659 RepID=A0ABT8YTN1_9HYPH|nr:hypothetical protein [Rhizobium alvei]MDO6967123.1 hypothetical protein [Rhizobium alvei]
MEEDILLGKEFGRALTQKLAPAESEFYDELVDAYSRPASSKRDHALAFGGSGDGPVIAVVLANVGAIVIRELWRLAQPAIAQLAEEAVAGVKENLSVKLRAWIDERFRSKPPIALSDNQVTTVVDAAKTRAKELGCDDAVVAEIGETIKEAISSPT